MLGKEKDALVLLQQALSLRKRLLGNEHPLVLEILELQTDVLMSQGKFMEAEYLLNRTVEMAMTFFSTA